MKKRILWSLVALFLIFAGGSLALISHISGITRSLGGLLQLHEVEHLRQNLVINIQTVQADLYRVRTPLAEDLDMIVANVGALDRAAAGCRSCHHPPALTKRLGEIGGLVEDYKTALSYYITAAADAHRIEALKGAGVVIGDRMLQLTQDMALAAGKSLQRSTRLALARIDQARNILYSTLVVALAFAVAAGAYLLRYLTRPVQALLSATRAIQAGSLGYTIEYADTTEFGELAGNFNAMSVALKEGYENLSRQQEALRESEWKFRTLSEYSSDWEYWIDATGELVYMSASCADLTGYALEEFQQNAALIRSILHPDDQDAFAAHLGPTGADRHQELEVRIVPKGGGAKWISHVCGPIYADGRYLGRFSSNRDITERKRLEEALAQSRKMESLGLLAGGIAHDFNNLLTAILGYASLLESRVEGERDRKAVGQITRAADRARELTASLLAFSRKQLIRPEAVDLNAVIANVSSLLGRVIGEDIHVRLSCAEGPLPALVDPSQLEHVLINLATNARDAMPGGGELEIATRSVDFDGSAASDASQRPGRYVVLSVRDTGSGVDPAALPHIFEPFFTTKEKGKGTGLGLATVHGTVEQHGGFLKVESERGHGTVVHVHLPRAEKLPAARGDAPLAPAGGAEDLGGHETVLIAEDEDAVREYLAEVLNGMGYRTILAADGEEAIRLYSENKASIDLVLLDVVMPRKNGKEVHDTLKGDNPTLKILFMSGYTKDILTTRGVHDEGLDVLQKPVQSQTLLRQIRKTLATV
ncbi:MAG: response regulator [Deltaproteobacteria bacterium]|nr:response regulator [Deltaproteobacteria bacterium]